MHYQALIHTEILRHRLTVIWTDLHGVRGDCDISTRTIRVDRSLTFAEIYCTLMHELAHFILGHIPNGDLEHDKAQDRAADEWAARRLIPTELLLYARPLARDLREMAEICGVDMDTMQTRLAIADGYTNTMSSLIVSKTA